MTRKFNAMVEQDVREAQFCRVAIYPPVRGWVGERVQLEVASTREMLGKCCLASDSGHYLVIDGAEAAREEAARIRGKVVELVRVGQ